MTELHVHYRQAGRTGEVEERAVPPGQFATEVLFSEHRARQEGEHHARVCLEDQPGVVAQSLGRLLGVLLKRGEISKEEFFHVLGVEDWEVKYQDLDVR